MGYVVVTGVDKQSGLYHAVNIDSEQFTLRTDYGYVTEANLAKFAVSGGDHTIPLNFSVDRVGKIVQNCGSFTRFSPKGSAVVIAEIKSKGGRVLGYRLLSCANNAIVNLRLEEILQKDKSMGDDNFLQNGIIRNNTVNCYPQKPFPVITMAVVKPQKPKQQPKAEQPKQQAQKSGRKAAPPPQEFTEKQQYELYKCQQAGVPVNLIRNNKLSPEQMRVLWVAKSKGCLSEHFNDPAYGVDAMKFYADRLYDDQTVVDCGDMLSHPELTADQLAELYACVCQGIPYQPYIGLSATDIGIQRDMSSAEYWGSSADLGDQAYLEKAMNAALKLHSEK